MTTVAAEDPFLAGFARRSRELPGDHLPWLRQKRQDAMALFRQRGLPTVLDEEWRQTPLTSLARTRFLPASRPVQWDESLKDLSTLKDCPWRLVFVDGFFAPRLSRLMAAPAGAYIGGMAEALNSQPERLRRYWDENPGARGSLGLLNDALFADGAYIYLPRRTALEGSIQLLFISTSSPSPVAAHTRVLIEAEDGAEADIIEEYASLGDGVYWNNVAVEIRAGETARISHCKIQRESASAFHTALLEVHQGKDSRFAGHSISWGGGLTRNDVRVGLEAVGAECELNGLYLAGGRQHVDNRTFIDHAQPHGTSRELYKGVLDGSARAVFNGTVQIRADAQKSSASVYNKNLILSDGGLVHTKPEFRISANDVIAKHGATIGRLSQDALFYLLSRGLSSEESRRILVYAFAREMVDKVGTSAVRDVLSSALAAHLPSLAGGRP